MTGGSAFAVTEELSGSGQPGRSTLRGSKLSAGALAAAGPAMSAEPSLLVIGGGPAGVTAALQGRELGAQVTLLESGQIGGTSLNRGPAPVRTLARAARLARDHSSWATFGLDGPPPVPNLPAVMANSERVARYAHDKKDMAGQLRRHGIDLVEYLGPARFTDPHTVSAAARRPGPPTASSWPSADTRAGSGFPAPSSRSPTRTSRP